MSAATNDFWRGRRVFLTGHSGFKGAWLAAWLRRIGAEVAGVSLPPATEPNLHGLLSGALRAKEVQDIRDAVGLAARLKEAAPEIVLHLAAQPLVRASYREPLETFSTNVMGTANLLDAIRRTASVRVAIVVTTDKVYENREEGRPFVEGDRLGGRDPYSNSKACAEFAAQCWRDSFFATAGGPAVATARAGNVIGGGDWSEDRLVPDLVRSMLAGRPVELRFPESVRPWQHVLDPLHGYLRLAAMLWHEPAACPPALNFGPDSEGFVTVSTLVERLDAALCGKGWVKAKGEHPPEARLLTLDTSLAKESLGWRPLLDVEETIGWTAEWWRAWREGADMRKFTLRQIDAYQERMERP